MASTRMSSTPQPPPASAAFLRRMYGRLGFQKMYNFVLWCIFGLGFLLFTLSRFPYLDYFGTFCRRNSLTPGLHAAPGECYYFLNGGREQVGMMLHLYGILPGCVLLFFQFIPAIRQRLLIFHRINGYVVIVLVSVGVVGALLSSKRSFGGDEGGFRLATWVHAYLVMIGLVLAMINIKRLQIEQHRAWMLRTWAWAFCVATMRVFQQIAARLVSGQGYAALRPCAQIASDGVLPTPVIQKAWPACAAYFAGTNPAQEAVVRADYYGLPAEANVALSVVSGTCALLALLVHAVGVEVYLHLTPAESERLRHISYHKQLAVGMKDPSRVGRTADRFGDTAKWCPNSKGQESEVDSDSDDEGLSKSSSEASMKS